MHQLILEPRDSLLFRDAKEFAGQAGSASSLPFPMPSSLAGAVRTRLGSDKKGRFDASKIGALMETPVSGPFLVSLKEDGSIQDWFFPAPADAVVFQDDEATSKAPRVRPLFPFDWPAEAVSEFTPWGLKPLSFTDEVREKPLANAPKFWSFNNFLSQWLSEPKVRKGSPGIAGPQRESRIHIRVGEKGTAEETALFATEMLRFVVVESGSLDTATRLALTGFVDRKECNLNGLFPIGGERRLAHWTSLPGTRPPSCPKEVVTQIVKHRRARLILATPGAFQQGVWRPETFGEGVELEAVSLRGAVVASGWDMAKNSPKPSRRLAPAGTVYFLSLPKDWKESQVQDWIQGHWFQSVCDDVQDRRDGFGICLVGAWTQPVATLNSRSSS